MSTMYYPIPNLCYIDFYLLRMVQLIVPDYTQHTDWIYPIIFMDYQFFFAQAQTIFISHSA